MSGGSWDYAHQRVYQLGEDLETRPFGPDYTHEEGDEDVERRKEGLRADGIDPEVERARRVKLGLLLQKCAGLAHAIEWYDSGDWGPEDLNEAYQWFEAYLKEIGGPNE